MRSLFDLLKTTFTMARTRIGWIFLAAILPFIASHLVVMQARSIGMPERLGLDLLHGFIVLSYLTAVVRIAQRRASPIAHAGLAWPKIRWPGFASLLRAAILVCFIGLPLALVLHPIVQGLESAQATQGFYFPVTMLPEFIMTTLVGLVLAAELNSTQS